MQNYNLDSSKIPHTTFLRLRQIIGPNGFIQISKTKFYSDIKKKVFPKPLKLGRVSVWKKSEILTAIEGSNNKGAGQ